jgi:hypothetical protein
MNSRVVEFIGGPLDGETREVVEPLPPIARTWLTVQRNANGHQYVTTLQISRDYRLGAIAKPEGMGLPWPRGELRTHQATGQRVWIEPVYLAEEFTGMLPK